MATDGPLENLWMIERRPRAVLAAQQARLRTEFLARYGVVTEENKQDVARHFDSGAIMTRYRYTSSAVVPDQASAADPDDGWVGRLTGQGGTRIPHVWLKSGRSQVSTLDLCGSGFTVLTGPDADGWTQAAEVAARETGLTLAVHRIGPGAEFVPVTDVWSGTVGLPADGALLVRPDAHVAARSDNGLSPQTLPGILCSLIGPAH